MSDPVIVRLAQFGRRLPSFSIYVPIPSPVGVKALIIFWFSGFLVSVFLSPHHFPLEPLDAIMSTTNSNVTHPPETRSGTTTSWLPLTTGSAPDGCSTLLWASILNTKIPFSAVAFDPFYAQQFDSATTCLPDYATAWWEQFQTQTYGPTVTSLGNMECPHLYTTAMSSALDSSSTFIACCPQYVFSHVTACPHHLISMTGAISMFRYTRPLLQDTQNWHSAFLG
jgi:hypothetical protein